MVKVVPSIILEDLNVLNLCLNCGAEHDRNVNAARNIETASGIPAELGEDNSLGRHTREWNTPPVGMEHRQASRGQKALCSSSR